MTRVRRESSLLYGVLLGVTALDIFSVERAEASDSKQQCLQAYEIGQRLRQAGDLVSAAGELRVCGGLACPVRMQSDCQRWLDDLERSTPTVIFRVRATSGELLSNVTVSIDGAAPRRLDGRALMMNPGEHRVVFQHPAHHVLQKPVFVTEGEKLEPREVTLHPLVRAAPAEDRLAAAPVAAPSSAWPVALAGVGVLGSAGVVFFGVRARNGEAALERCSPDCSRGHVDEVERDFLWSNISLGVGVAGLVGAGFWLLLDEQQVMVTPRHGVQLGRTVSWVTRF